MKCNTLGTHAIYSFNYTKRYTLQIYLKGYFGFIFCTKRKNDEKSEYEPSKYICTTFVMMTQSNAQSARVREITDRRGVAEKRQQRVRVSTLHALRWDRTSQDEQYRAEFRDKFIACFHIYFKNSRCNNVFSLCFFPFPLLFKLWYDYPDTANCCGSNELRIATERGDCGTMVLR